MSTNKILIFIVSVISFFSCLAATDINKVSIFSDTGFQASFRLPAANVQINQQTVPLLIDLGFSGNQADIVLKRTMAQKLGIVGHLPKICGQSQSGKTCYLTATIATFKIGQKILHHVKALIALSDWGGGALYKKMHKGASYQNGVITFAFLQKYNLLFNFPKHKIILLN